MTDSSQDSPLTPLQKDVLAAFFSSERGFFLTGGAALAGYWLRHRATSDLDLFTLEDLAFERGPYELREVAAKLGATLEVRVDAAGFKRFALTRADEALVVDLVRERVMQRSGDSDASDRTPGDQAGAVGWAQKWASKDIRAPRAGNRTRAR